MMLATRKRVEALEAIAPAKRRGSGLDREIEEMSSEERDVVRRYLLHVKAGGLPGQKEHDALKRDATAVVFAARERF